MRLCGPLRARLATFAPSDNDKAWRLDESINQRSLGPRVQVAARSSAHRRSDFRGPQARRSHFIYSIGRRPQRALGATRQAYMGGAFKSDVRAGWPADNPSACVGANVALPPAAKSQMANQLSKSMGQLVYVAARRLAAGNGGPVRKEFGCKRAAIISGCLSLACPAREPRPPAEGPIKFPAPSGQLRPSAC